MDTLTHALSGALLARVTAPTAPRNDPGPDLAARARLSLRARILAGGLAAAFPDVDFLLRAADTLTYLQWHQGLTHSLPLLPVWALLLAWLFARASGGYYSWRLFYGPVCLGLLAHIAGDLVTSYGPMLLAPLSMRRFSVPLLYLIDPWVTLVLAVGLAASLRPVHGRLYAGTALLLVAGYAGYQAVLQERALAIGAAYAGSQGLDGAKVHALPQPISPCNWTILVTHGAHYERGWVNLCRRRVIEPEGASGLLQSLHAAYRPPTAIRWRRYGRYGETAAEAALAREAWNRSEIAGFRRFAAFPALEGVRRENGRVCVRFKDLRFELPLLPDSFRYDLCCEASGERWRLERVRGAFWID